MYYLSDQISQLSDVQKQAVNREEFRNYCLSKKGVSEGFPFDEKTLVFKVLGKMFILTDVNTFESINIKCDPGNAIELRQKYPSVIPGYHMDKRHWNTVILDGSIEDKLIYQWIDDSYNLVVARLPKAQRQELEEP